MKVCRWGAFGTAVILAAILAPSSNAEAQGRDALVRAFDVGRGARIGASVATNEEDAGKDARPGVSIETVEPGGPADKAGIKAGDAVTEFDGERVRSVRQFLRLVQESTPGRNVAVVLSRGRGEILPTEPTGDVDEEGFKPQLTDLGRRDAT